MPVSMPTVAQIDELPSLMERVIPPEWEDLNGHVNVRHYLELYDAASWPMLAAIGLDEKVFLERRQGCSTSSITSGTCRNCMSATR